MSRNGRHTSRRPHIEMRGSAATREEAAAIAAAIEQFLRDTAPAPEAAAATSGWARSAILGAVGAPDAWAEPWGDREPWGR